MKKFFIIVFILLSFYVSGQFNLLNASSPEEVGVKTEKQEELDFNEPLVYPYVDDKDFANMPDEYSHEPKMSLKGGKDGLKLVRRILRDSAKFLTDKGVLIVEVGNSRLALEQTFPEIAFFWFEFEEGDEGVFMLTSNELKAHSELFK